MPTESDRSYRSLLAVPTVGRLLIGMQVARIAQSMVSVAMVLFALGSYGSATVAGMAAFFSIFPGLLVSPLAGALLDRHGRKRLVVLDYAIALGSLVLTGLLALEGLLPPALLVAIAGIASLTAPLSTTGLRSVFPLIVPAHLWERVNAIDSTGYVFATVIGPPIAAGMVAIWGGPVSFVVIGLVFGAAAVVVNGALEPKAPVSSTGSLVGDAWRGLLYAWRNRTLRALGFSVSMANLTNGIYTIIVPLIVLEKLHFAETAVGLVFAVQGLAGIVSAVLIGNVDTRGRERTMLAATMAGTGLCMALLLWRNDLRVLLLVMAVTGLLNGPLDVAMFTLRQRRTDPAWTGRAFAVSMAFNAMGVPVGSAAAGILASRSTAPAVALGAISSVVAGVLAAVLIPHSHNDGRC